jgi:hypothetical protein
MWRCVELGFTDVSEECIVSIFRVELSASGAAASCSHVFTARGSIHPEDRGDTLIGSSETSVNPSSTQRHIPEDNILQEFSCFSSVRQEKFQLSKWFGQTTVSYQMPSNPLFTNHRTILRYRV